MGLPRRVGEHLEHVGLRPLVGLVRDLPGVLVGPDLLPLGLDRPGVVAVHAGSQGYSRGRGLPGAFDHGRPGRQAAAPPDPRLARDAADLGRNVAPLADAGFDVIAPDLRGFGDSRSRPTTATTRRRTPRSRRAGARRARRTTASSRWRRPRRRGASRTCRSASRASSSGSCLFNTIPPRYLTGARRAVARGRRRGRRLLHPPGTRRRRARRRARRRPSSAGATSRRSTARASGRTGRVRRGTSTRSMTEPFGDARPLRAVDRRLRVRGRAAQAPQPTRADSSENPTPTLILLRPRGPRDPARLPERMEACASRPRRAVRRARAPATSSSGSAPTC